jgi:chromate reductase, NAD(P)H dehydrogenase (quinone)
MSLNVLALCGSLRRISMNAALLRATARLAPEGFQVRIFGGLAALPLFNPDREADLPAPVRDLHAAIAACDAVLIASPEYAHGITGVLKNALDWLVSFEGFIDKRVAIFNASPRSVHADASLREILTTMSAHIVNSACLSLPLRGLNLSEQQMFDSEHAPAIRRALLALNQEGRA